MRLHASVRQKTHPSVTQREREREMKSEKLTLPFPCFDEVFTHRLSSVEINEEEEVNINNKQLLDFYCTFLPYGHQLESHH